LILNPHGREFVPWNEYGRSFREELLRRFPEGVDLYETALATARSGDAEEGPFADYLQALFAKRQLDLVVAVSKSCDPLCSKISTADISIRSRRIHGGRAASSAAGQQAIINLVMNGMEAMEEARPHHLTIRTRQNPESGTVEVRVSDSGKGIPKDNMTSIFDAFVTTKPKGTGLGLPIARTIVESHGGDIWAENRQRGAVFLLQAAHSAGWRGVKSNGYRAR
jgi:light-regulated signal transduction histidine kinase (bacteriophytochrome)